MRVIFLHLSPAQTVNGFFHFSTVSVNYILRSLNLRLEIVIFFFTYLCSVKLTSEIVLAFSNAALYYVGMEHIRGSFKCGRYIKFELQFLHIFSGF